MDNQQVKSCFNLVSDSYDKLALRTASVSAQHLVEFARIHTGQKVLDVATGTGNAAIAAAYAVGESGEVIAVDIAENMREEAQRKVSAVGLTNVNIREGDALALPLGDNSFDVVISASAVYCWPDILTGLRELQRVTKPGGRVAFSSWGEIGDNSVVGVYKACLQNFGIALPPVMPLQRVDTPDKCRQLLQDTGLENIEIYTEELGYYVESVEECWDFIWYTGNRMHLAQLEPEKIEQFKVEFLKQVKALETDKGIWMDSPAIFALAQKSVNS